MNQPLTPNGFNGVAIFSAGLFFFGCLTQVVTCAVLSSQGYRRKVMMPYFMNIVAGNFLFLFGSLPTTFIASMMHGKFFYSYPALCNISGFISGCGAISMIVTMSCITCELCSLTKSGIASENVTLKTPHYKVVVGIWIYTIALMTPPTVGLTTMKIEGSGTHCTPNWLPDNAVDTGYGATLLLLAYVFPVSFAMMYLIKCHYEFKSVAFIDNPILNLCFSTLRDIHRMSVLAVSLFTITWLPYAVLVVISICSGKKAFSVDAEIWPTLFVKLSATFNPYIYAITDPRFRKDILKLIKRCRPNRNTTTESHHNAADIHCGNDEHFITKADMRTTWNLMASENTNVHRISVQEATSSSLKEEEGSINVPSASSTTNHSLRVKKDQFDLVEISA